MSLGTIGERKSREDWNVLAMESITFHNQTGRKKNWKKIDEKRQISD